MSAPNFYSEAGTVFAIETNDNDDDDFIVNDVKENVFSTLEANQKISVQDADRYDSDRNYGGHIFADVELCKTHNPRIYPQLEVIMRSGYYSGVNLDYSIKIYSESGESFEVEDIDNDTIMGELVYLNDRRPSDLQVHATLRELNNEVEKLKQYVEAVYTDLTTPLIRVATFSNGEAVYEKREKTVTRG